MKYTVLPTKAEHCMYYIPDSDDQKGGKDIYTLFTILLPVGVTILIEFSNDRNLNLFKKCVLVKFKNKSYCLSEWSYKN